MDLIESEEEREEQRPLVRGEIRLLLKDLKECIMREQEEIRMNQREMIQREFDKRFQQQEEKYQNDIHQLKEETNRQIEELHLRLFIPEKEEAEVAISHNENPATLKEDQASPPSTIIVDDGFVDNVFSHQSPQMIEETNMMEPCDKSSGVHDGTSPSISNEPRNADTKHGTAKVDRDYSPRRQNDLGASISESSQYNEKEMSWMVAKMTLSSNSIDNEGAGRTADTNEHKHRKEKMQISPNANNSLYQEKGGKQSMVDDEEEGCLSTGPSENRSPSDAAKMFRVSDGDVPMMRRNSSSCRRYLLQCTPNIANQQCLEEDVFTLMMLNQPFRNISHCNEKLIKICGVMGLLGFLSIYAESFRHIFHFTIRPDVIYAQYYFYPILAMSVLMMHGFLSSAWLLPLYTFLFFQLGAGLMIIVDQLVVAKGYCSIEEEDINQCLPFDIPIFDELRVTISKYFTAFFAFAAQSDLFTSLQTVSMLRNADHVPWDKVIGEDGNRTWRLWLLRILLPNIFKFIQGAATSFASFIIIIQSNRIIDLLKDFTALLIVSHADNIMFCIARQGYFGRELERKTAEAQGVRWTIVEDQGSSNEDNRPHCDRSGKSCFGLRASLLLVMYIIIMIGGLSYFVAGQYNGKWMRRKYPDCHVDNTRAIGDGWCQDYLPYNSAECGWDGGDCPTPAVVKGYPYCAVSYPDKIGNGRCENNPTYNSTECGFDGGDCIPRPLEFYLNCLLLPEDHDSIGDGSCHDKPPYNTEACGWDGGDCTLSPVEGYSDCMVVTPERVGDGHCHDWPPYNSEECGFDGGDCMPQPVE